MAPAQVYCKNLGEGLLLISWFDNLVDYKFGTSSSYFATTEHSLPANEASPGRWDSKN